MENPNKIKDKIIVLNNLRDLIDNYFSKFSEIYPLKTENDLDNPKTTELSEIAIQARCLVSILGERVYKRLKFIGFDKFFPFDNPVDYSNWGCTIRSEKIPYTAFCEIIIRMKSEFERIKFFLENDKWDEYESLDEATFLTTCDYLNKKFGKADAEIQANSSSEHENNDFSNPLEIGALNININKDNSQDVFQKLNTHTSIWSNTLNIISKFIGIKI